MEFDQATFDGNLKLKVYRIDPQYGKILIATYEDSNLITISGLRTIAYLLAGENGRNTITKVGVGNGTSPTHASDVGLTNATIKDIDSYSYLRNNVVEYKISMDTGDGNGMDISEFGLYSGDEVLFARRLQSPSIPKEPDIIIEGVWSVSIFQCKEWEFAATTSIKFIINNAELRGNYV
jgi:hypothetical protein